MKIKWMQHLAWMAVALASSAAAAAGFPDRQIKLVAAYPPAGGVDVAARIVANELSTRLGWTIVVENKPGAAGSVGTAAVATSPADGYTVLITANPSITIVPYISNVSYDPVKDLVPVAKMAVSPTIIAVQKDASYRTLKDFLEAGRSKSLTIGIPGARSNPQAELMLLGKQADSRIEPVPYKGATFIVQDVLGGQIDAGAMALPAIVPQIEGGKMRGLAVISSQRSGVLPDVPTVREAAGIDMDGIPTWYGFFVPAGTPPEAIATLEKEIMASVRNPDAIAKLKAAGADALQVGSKQFTDEIAQETRLFKQTVEEFKSSF